MSRVASAGDRAVWVGMTSGTSCSSLCSGRVARLSSTGSRGSGKTYACVAMCSHFEKKHYITRTFLICPTKASNDIFQNLKTLDEKTENTNVNLYLSTKDKLKTLAINNGISVSNVIRSAINDMLDKEGK